MARRGRPEPAGADLREALQRIAEIEEIYRSAPVGLCLVDADLRFLRINERLAAINGCDVEDHIGRTVPEVIPELSDQVVPRLRKVLETGEPIENVEVKGVLPSEPDVERTWLASDHPVKAADGSVTGIVTVVQDITERTHREAALRVARARFADAERVARLGCWEWNLHTGEMWWSDEIYRMMGREPLSIEPNWESFIEHVVTEHVPRLRESLQALYAGKDFIDDEFPAIGVDGVEHLLHARARLVRTEEGEPHILFGTTQDITEHRRVVEKLEAERAAAEAERERLERLVEERTRELDRTLDRLRREKR